MKGRKGMDQAQLRQLFQSCHFGGNLVQRSAMGQGLKIVASAVRAIRAILNRES
jgi:hypothetical protein